ncbi:MAG: hypothetical protein E8D49_05410 [Nitrospira sp.]|nr:MAG: hypothetical protein E8D49_05410 [Nitrospira sp.]
MVKRFTAWVFTNSQKLHSLWRVIAWWELRRIPFNVIVLAYGAIGFVIFLWAITTSGHLQPGEDVVEPLALLAAPFVVNLLYTLGWLVEAPARYLIPDLSSGFGPMLLKLGLGLGLFLISIPAVFWGGYKLLQLVEVAP